MLVSHIETIGVYRCADARMAYNLLRYDNARTKHIEIDKGDHGFDNVSDTAAEEMLRFMAELSVLENIE